MPNKNEPKSELTFLWIVLFIVVLIVGGFSLWKFWIKGLVVSLKVPTTAQTDSSFKSNMDMKLVGTWESDCLVPDPYNPWSESHKFIINTNGTATHIRFSSKNSNCSPDIINADDFRLFFPGDKNQIDLTSLPDSGIIDGNIYDIYKISDNILLFGHGFRNNFTYPSENGESTNSRINNLNEYIVYHKK